MDVSAVPSVMYTTLSSGEKVIPFGSIKPSATTRMFVEPGTYR